MEEELNCLAVEVSGYNEESGEVVSVGKLESSMEAEASEATEDYYGHL